MSTAMLGVVLATFGFTKAKFGGIAAVKVGTVCGNGIGYYTEQPTCAPFGTGPQCTVLIGLTSYPAFVQNSTVPCSVPLYVWNP